MIKTFLALVLIVAIQIFTIPLPKVYAATTPSLGQAASFGILSSTYTNTVGGTTINGDLGYTTGPASAPTVNGTTYSPPSSKYSTAGTDQGSALTALNAQPCTHTFPDGAVDLATDTSHGGIGVYSPGVYCTGAASAASIGAAGITLTGSGTFIFRIDGALTTVANSVVTLSGGASACDVFWTPAAATTLGATSTFAGTDIDDSGITIGTTVTWSGRALSFGGTVSTTADTITAPTCSSAVAASSTTSSGGTTSSTGGSSNSCPTINAVTPIILESRRIDSDSVFVSWGPYSGVTTFNVRYGVQNGDWLYNTNVTGFSTTINDLPENQPIWVQVAARNDCSIGNFSEAQYSGGPSLPNAGRPATRQTMSWHMITAILALISGALVLTKKRSAFFHKH